MYIYKALKTAQLWAPQGHHTRERHYRVTCSETQILARTFFALAASVKAKHLKLAAGTVFSTTQTLSLSLQRCFSRGSETLYMPEKPHGKKKIAPGTRTAVVSLNSSTISRKTETSVLYCVTAESIMQSFKRGP